MYGRAILLAAVVALAGCGGSSEPVSEPLATPSPTSPSLTQSPATPTPLATEDPPATAPALPETTTLAPTFEITSIDDSVLIDHDRRTALAGADTYYWPDGTIGGVDLGDGTITYFAANGPVIARTAGSSGQPGERLLDASITIDGIADDFGYAAGGPVHFDAASNTVLLWYHAERHLDGAALFHAAIGLARSTDGGASFTDLGIIVETNSPPSAAAPCCADVGGAPVIARDGTFHVYFRDRVGPTGTSEIQLARASAPVDEVLAAAANGTTSDWSKYANGDATPGRGGRSSALEPGNPRTSWFDVAWHDGIGAYLLVIAEHGTLTDPSTIWLTASTDGVNWSPRQAVAECECELTYPSFLGVLGTDRVVGGEVTISYVATAADATFRWERTDLRQVTILVD